MKVYGADGLMLEHKLLVVYNICELAKINIDTYSHNIESILRQNYTNYKVAVSGCKVSDSTKIALQYQFMNKVSFCFIDDLFPVNITFNKTVKECIKKFGEFDGYIYIDSGIDFENQVNCLIEVNNRIDKSIGMLDFQASNDNGYPNWFKKAESDIFVQNDFKIPIGRAINLHVHFFDKSIYDFYENLIPDIFLAYCTESIFSFQCAALQKNWMIIKDIVLLHNKSVDGATAGFNHSGKHGQYWNNLYGDLNIYDIINDPLAKQYGLGYEEMAGIMVHDPKVYDENGFALCDELKYYIKDKLFLPKSILDYNNIESIFK